LEAIVAMKGFIVGAPSSHEFIELFFGNNSAHTEECLAKTFSGIKKDWSEEWPEDRIPDELKRERAARLVKEWSKEWSKDLTDQQTEEQRARCVVRVCIREA
jgi:hypothetical protein